MKKFIENLTNIWKIEELKNRIILTLGILLVYRFGAHIVLPGIDSAQLHELANRTSGGGLLDILNAFTGGAFSNASVFALGDYALHLGFYRSAIDGYCYSLSSKATERGREWAKKDKPNHSMAYSLQYVLYKHPYTYTVSID